jgi:ankyrin repeat protein
MVNAEDIDKLTPLLEAAKNSDTYIIIQRIKAGANVNAKNNKGQY